MATNILTDTTTVPVYALALIAFVCTIIGGILGFVVTRKVIWDQLKRAGVVVLLLGLFVSRADAQSLRTATYVFSSAAAADWTMTYQFLDRKATVEGNPLLQWTHNDPAATVAAGAAMDVAAVYAWRRFVGRKHPKIAAVGLYATAALRGYYVAKSAAILNGYHR